MYLRSTVPVIIGIFASLLPVSARAESPCQRVLLTPNPDEASADTCLKRRPIVSGSGTIGYLVGGGSNPTLFGRLDMQALSPFWLSTRVRYAGNTQFDLLAGWALSTSYGRGHHTFVSSRTKVSSSVERVTYTGKSTYMRKATVLAVGLKGGIVPDHDVGAMGKDELQLSIAQAGLQWHTASGFGSHITIEAYALYNFDTGEKGGSVLWHNSIPSGGGFVFGMEAGYIPFDKAQMIFWAMIEVGYSFEL